MCGNLVISGLCALAREGAHDDYGPFGLGDLWWKNWNANTPPSATKLLTCGAIFDAPSLRAQLTEIETKLSDPGVWSDQERSQQLMRPRKRLEASLAMDAELARRADDIAAYFDLALEGDAATDHLPKKINNLRQIAEKLQLHYLPPTHN